MLAICKADVPVEHKAPNTSSYTRKKDSKGKKPGVKSGHRKQPTSSKHHPLFKIEATKGGSSKAPTGSKTGHLVKEIMSSSVLDTNPSQPPASTPVAVGLHKEDQQATGGPTSLEIKEEFNTSLNLSSSDDAKQEIKLEDLSKLVPNVEADFMDLDSPKDDPIIVVDESKGEEETKKIHATKYTETEDSSVSYPPSLSSVPTELKELPFKFNDLTEEVTGQKKHVHELEIELLGDLKEIPNKLETFTSTIKSLYTQVAELKTLQWEHPAEFQSVPKVSSVQAKLKTLDALLIPQEALLKLRGSLSRQIKARQTMSSKDDEEEETESDSENDYANPVNSMVESSKKKKLKKFDFVTEGGKHVYFTAEKIEEQKRIEESLKADLAKQEEEKVKNELFDLMGIDVMTKYYKDKLLCDKYYDKMLNRRKSSKIINYDVLTKKGPITLKVYREDRTAKVILNFKVSDLHLAEWREMVKAYPNRKGKGWKTIYKQIKTRMDYLYQTKAELNIELNKPLGEQDPLDELNDPANKKMKRADEFHNYIRSTKKLKSSIQYGDHPAEDFEDLSNEMLYTVHEVFLRFHQGPDLNDNARTFSSFLLAKGRLLVSVPEPFSLSIDLNIISPKYNSKLKIVQLESLRKLHL
ncbi:hypothetical protein Tco_0335148 [Tanacetum coccineum]